MLEKLNFKENTTEDWAATISPPLLVTSALSMFPACLGKCLIRFPATCDRGRLCHQRAWFLCSVSSSGFPCHLPYSPLIENWFLLSMFESCIVVVAIGLSREQTEF